MVLGAPALQIKAGIGSMTGKVVKIMYGSSSGYKWQPRASSMRKVRAGSIYTLMMMSV